MRKNYFLNFLFLLMVDLFLTACGTKEQASSEKQNNAQEEQVEKTDAEEVEEIKVSSTVPEILEEERGKSAGTKYNTVIVHKELFEENY